ncbi:MAG: hypothetical protein ACLR4Z_03540 [Butyricicoccaceae bacterium]
MNVLLTLCFRGGFPPILSKGSLIVSARPTSHLACACGAFVPLVLRPWRRNHPFAENHTRLYAAVLLVHDVLLFLSAAAVSLILVEYMVKGCGITLKQSFWQGWMCYVAVYAAAYLITARNVRIARMPRHGQFQPDPRHDRPLRYAVPRHACHAERHCSPSARRPTSRRATPHRWSCSVLRSRGLAAVAVTACACA